MDRFESRDYEVWREIRRLEEVQDKNAHLLLGVSGYHSINLDKKILIKLEKLFNVEAGYLTSRWNEYSVEDRPVPVCPYCGKKEEDIQCIIDRCDTNTELCCRNCSEQYLLKIAASYSFTSSKKITGKENQCQK